MKNNQHFRTINRRMVYCPDLDIYGHLYFKGKRSCVIKWIPRDMTLEERKKFNKYKKEIIHRQRVYGRDSLEDFLNLLKVKLIPRYIQTAVEKKNES